MIPLMLAALGGGVVTALIAAPLGTVTAVLAAPLGASACTLLAAFHLARRRGSDWQTQVDLDEQTDAMVAALRGLAKQVSDAEGGPSRGTDTVRAA